MFGFGKKNDSISGTMFVNPCEDKKEPIKKVEPVEEWIWVNGYKATEKDMTCRGYQYEMNKVFDISEDKPVEECKHGFHMCLGMGDVRRYYDIGNSHRFFEVKALVRKKDYEHYGPSDYYLDEYGRVCTSHLTDKLAAKSIIFTRELTMDEILESTHASDWSTEYKQLAIEIGLKKADLQRKVDILTKLGYSETFAREISKDNKLFVRAETVGSQEGLSMDMKVWCIFNGCKLGME